jgi:hypothetical protein
MSICVGGERLDERSRMVAFLWIIFIVISVALGGFDHLGDGAIDWAYWPWIGMGIGFSIATAGTYLGNMLCPKCGKMVSREDNYCRRCGHKLIGLK